MMSGMVMARLVPVLTYYGATSNVIEEVSSVVAPVIQREFSFDYLGLQGNSEIVLCLCWAGIELSRAYE